MNDSTQSVLRKNLSSKLKRIDSEMSNLRLNDLDGNGHILNDADRLADLESRIPLETHEPEDHYFKGDYRSYWQRKFKTHYKVIIYLLFFLMFLLTIKFFAITFTSNDFEGENDFGSNDINRRSFDIENTMNGEFVISETLFKFIRPPKQLLKHEQDPGLYYTTEIQEDGSHLIKAGQLYNKEFNKNIIGTTFIYEGNEYQIHSIEVNYSVDTAILGTNIIKKYRHSSIGLYFIYSIDTNVIHPIHVDNTDKEWGLSYAHFSPAYNFIYFVHQNDLYFMDVKERRITRVSSNGNDIVFNGKTSWVYEEEVLSTDVAVWWAPDDSKFVFAEFNELDVNSMTFQLYTDPNLLNKYSSINYPLPGSKNPTVKLFLYTLNDNVLSKLEIGEGTQKYNNDVLIYDVAWLTPNELLLKISDRSSKELEVLIFNSEKNLLTRTRTVNSSAFNGWIEKQKKITVIPPNNAIGRRDYGYIDIQPDENGFNHLFFYAKLTSSLGRQLTAGDWEVTGAGVVGFDFETNTVLFTSNKASSFSQHLSGTRLDSNEPLKIESFQNPDDIYSFYEFSFSSSTRYVISRNLGPGVPVTNVGTLMEVVEEDESKSTALYLSKHLKLKETLNNYDLPVKSYKTMKMNDGVVIDYIEIKPLHIDSNKKYPLLVNVYGGPGSRTFDCKYGIEFESTVSSGLDAIVLQIEPRGTGGKGWAYRSWAKLKLGYWEPSDIIEVTNKFIQSNKAHINEDKVAIWGWSYGGFSTLKTVEIDAGQTFKYAMAVAPVTNWALYDSVYTERYMNTPKENPKGYNEISLIRNIQNFASLKRLLLIHGTADENVHIKNTYTFSNALNTFGIGNYDLHIYPDSGHSISHNNDLKMVYRRLYSWLGNAFTV
ncbi:hypothetical protein TPHA_0G01810 [Tetrapisispora phaffii CBS 4417]|uniref:Dipeptidyl aminopeptidase A n=1 Tax=Tetrapisispora phaffii (strain ATCC 24235 / CBS 4417 / NBRC 1672 / NRRL Y-8282 / UCD 70-5) TaxID=1071381 RepID=G8BVT9_TETPH|nr:hypothetical protein TPHA_0G01810 [Tetrapisispora phaffii CBS 4417]CCE64017.1 hypothetical protein TPHA_0G01810 [Tetrapisispora phaffii CBS 4417]